MRTATAGAMAALVLVALDVGAVAAALPSVRVDLGSSTSGVVWVQDGYLLALAAGLVAIARIPMDRRLRGAAGAALFAAGAVLASSADATSTLVTGRVLQGAGSAALVGPALETLRASGRSRAWTALGAAGLLGLALAPLAGGAIAEEASWRWLFRLEAAALPALLLVAAAAGGGRSGRSAAWDGGRSAALAGGLVCGATGLVQSGPWGWASADTLLLLLAGAGLLLYAWRDTLGTPEAVALTLAGCLAATLLLIPQYLDLVRGLSPLRCGVLALALTLPAAALAAAARLAARRPPPRLLLTGGLACAALGALGVTRIDPVSSYALVVLSLALLGAGTGAAAGALPQAGEPRRSLAPAAAAGAALVVAASGALLQRAQLDERASGGSFEDALAAGVAASGWLMAALLVAAGLAAWRSR